MAEQEAGFLESICNGTVELGEELLKEASEQQLEAVGEVCYNILYGDIELNLLYSLKPCAALIRKLGNPDLDASSRQKSTINNSAKIVSILKKAHCILP